MNGGKRFFGAEEEERAAAMRFDAIGVVRETEIRIVFSQWIRLEPGHRHLLFLDGAVVTRPDVRIAALVRAASFESSRTRKLRKRAS